MPAVKEHQATITAEYKESSARAELGDTRREGASGDHHCRVSFAPNSSAEVSTYE
jgi:hypothetical protein